MNPCDGVAYPYPYIDERVEYIGVSSLRLLNSQSLRRFDKLLVIHDREQALAVILPYEQFMEMQRHLVAALKALERKSK